MANGLPPLTWFRAFEVAARHLNFTAAAEELHVTQSAVSQHVRALEHRFGVRLFERKARGLALTESGRQLLPYVTGAVDELAKATRLFLPESKTEDLEISCTTSFAVLWLFPRMQEFRALSPHATIRVLSTLWPDDYLKEKADIQIRFGNRSLVGDDAIPIGDNEIVPICSPDRAAIVRGPDDLWHVPLIHTAGASYDWEAWAKHIGASPPPPANQVVDSMIAAKTLAESGIGAALASRFLCRPSLARGDIVIPVDRGLAASDQFFLTLSGLAGKKPLATAFRDWLFEEIDGS